MKSKPDLNFWKLWNLSFGFFGVQIAYALQSANVSRIFATLGADPHDLSYFWILPPLMGLIVQPIVGTMSDRTWNRFGRRLPYLIAGAAVAILVMCLLPNAGSFGLTVSSAIMVGLIALMLLDTSINMAMQPFKMLVGDMVNEKQKGLAYSIQSFLCNAGSIVGFVFPFVLTWIGIRNTAPEGVVPPTVVFSFYIGAGVLLLCVAYSLLKIREWPPALYAEYNGGDDADSSRDKPAEKAGIVKLLRTAPSTFWTVGLVQFFCWFAFLFMWTYTNGTVAKNAFDTPATTVIRGIAYEGTDGKTHDIDGNYVLLPDSSMVLEHGRAAVAGFTTANGHFTPAQSLSVAGGDTLVENSFIVTRAGVAAVQFNQPIALNGRSLIVNGTDTVTPQGQITLVDRLSRLSGDATLTVAGIAARDPHSGMLTIEGAHHVTVPDASKAYFRTMVELNTESPEYNDAGNWVGILFAVQAIGSVLWAVVLPMFHSRKFCYSLSLLLGAVGFVTASFITDKYLLFISFALIGCAWAAMLAWPFTILTNSLKSGRIGTYLGLFNGSICIPQIIGALVGGLILSAIGSADEVAPQATMMTIAGISLAIGAICVVFIREHSNKQE